MGVQSFNDTASVNGPVAGGGGKSAASPQGESKGRNSSPAQQADGTANLRATAETKQAGMPSGANSSGDKSPAQKIGDGTSV